MPGTKDIIPSPIKALSPLRQIKSPPGDVIFCELREVLLFD